MSETTIDPQVPARPNDPDEIIARTAGRDAALAGDDISTCPYAATGVTDWEKGLREFWLYNYQRPDEPILTEVTGEGVIADGTTVVTE